MSAFTNPSPFVSHPHGHQALLFWCDQVLGAAEACTRCFERYASTLRYLLRCLVALKCPAVARPRPRPRGRPPRMFRMQQQLFGALKAIIPQIMARDAADTINMLRQKTPAKSVSSSFAFAVLRSFDVPSSSTCDIAVMVSVVLYVASKTYLRDRFPLAVYVVLGTSLLDFATDITCKSHLWFFDCFRHVAL